MNSPYRTTQSYFDEGELVANVIMMENVKSLITVCYSDTDVYVPQFSVSIRKHINPELQCGNHLEPLDMPMIPAICRNIFSC
jgi:hypothetical protein